jgi:hypothetical protein
MIKQKIEEASKKCSDVFNHLFDYEPQKLLGAVTNPIPVSNEEYMIDGATHKIIAYIGIRDSKLAVCVDHYIDSHQCGF